MGLLDIATSFFRRGGGFWEYMSERTKSRTAIELERERNAATANVIPMLKPGVDFMESEEGGRTRVIRVSPVPQNGGSPNGSAPNGTSLPRDGDQDSAPASPPALGPGTGTGHVASPRHRRQDDQPVGDHLR
ncbi:hypothetical protein [Streptomyces sp. NPDC050504]|uniref:hypothetical protein n=1 Tax=Streptomyces sp. NPDC050504 TaxID=3365618 RepID=UPI00379DCADD